MKIHALIGLSVIVFLTSNALAGWEEDIFIEAQELMAASHREEAEIMRKFDAEVGPFYDLWIPFQEAHRKLALIAFRLRLSNNPNSIQWNDPWIWSAGIESTDEERQLAEMNEEFKTAYIDYKAKKEALLARKDLFKKRNQVYKEHEDLFRELEERDFRKLYDLQNKVDKLRNR